MIGIVAKSQNQVIGLNGKLPWNIREDMQHFKSSTMNQVVIMGGNTYRSLPFSKLPNRINIVITNQSYESKDKSLIFVNSKKECLEKLKDFPNLKHFVIGGAAIYEMFCEEITEWIITEIEREYEGDVFFNPLWNKLQRISKQELTDCVSIVHYK